MINGIGAVCTGIVALVVVVSKFTKGAWIPAVLIPVMVVAFLAIAQPLPEGAVPPSRSSPGTSPDATRTPS